MAEPAAEHAARQPRRAGDPRGARLAEHRGEPAEPVRRAEVEQTAPPRVPRLAHRLGRRPRRRRENTLRAQPRDHATRQRAVAACDRIHADAAQPGDEIDVAGEGAAADRAAQRFIDLAAHVAARQLGAAQVVQHPRDAGDTAEQPERQWRCAQRLRGALRTTSRDVGRVLDGKSRAREIGKEHRRAGIAERERWRGPRHGLGEQRGELADRGGGAAAQRWIGDDLPSHVSIRLSHATERDRVRLHDKIHNHDLLGGGE